MLEVAGRHTWPQYATFPLWMAILRVYPTASPVNSYLGVAGVPFVAQNTSLPAPIRNPEGRPHKLFIFSLLKASFRVGRVPIQIPRRRADRPGGRDEPAQSLEHCGSPQGRPSGSLRSERPFSSMPDGGRCRLRSHFGAAAMASRRKMPTSTIPTSGAASRKDSQPD